jgi:hypothetical protein
MSADVLPSRTVACQECGAELKIPAGRSSFACPYCKCPTVIERPPSAHVPTPALVLPFVVPEEAARAAVTAWKKRWRWFHTSLAGAAVEEIQGVYLPAYLYSAALCSRYSAEIGEDYQETETYTTTEDGKTVERTRTVTKTEWRSLYGEHVGYVADVLVTASRGLPNAELEAIEPFDMRLLRRYQAALVAGWTSEDPSIAPADGVQMARAEAVAIEGKRVAAFLPGDSQRAVQFQTMVDRETLDLTLVPVWTLVIRPDPKQPAQRVLVNGQTALVWGRERWSVLKILALVGLIAAIVAAVWLAARGGR